MACPTLREQCVDHRINQRVLWHGAIRIYHRYPIGLESPAICRCHYKSSTFSLVILRPCVLVRPELNSRPPAWQPSAQPTETTIVDVVVIVPSLANNISVNLWFFLYIYLQGMLVFRARLPQSSGMLCSYWKTMSCKLSPSGTIARKFVFSPNLFCHMYSIWASIAIRWVIL